MSFFPSVIFLAVWFLVVKGGGGLVQLSALLSLAQVLVRSVIVITRVTELIEDAILSLCVWGGEGE